jgi:hypothetical protein
MLQADESAGSAPADEPSTLPEEAAPAPIEDLIEALRGGDKDAAAGAMDALVARGEEAIQPLIDLRESSEDPGAERATQTLGRIGVVGGLYTQVELFRSEFEPHEKIGVRFVFRNYGKKPVTIFNPVSPRNPESAYGLGWKLTLKTTAGKKVADVDMNEKVSAKTVGQGNLVTLQPGEMYGDVVYLETLFGLEKSAQGEYTIESTYATDKTVLEAVKKRSDLKAEDLFMNSITPPAVHLKVAPPGTGAVDKETEAKIRKLIEELGSEQYRTRRNAETELDELGTAALKYLKEAVDATRDPQIRYIAQQLIDKIEKPAEEMITYLGIRMDQSFSGKGVLVMSVIDSSPAEKAGLRSRDAIVRINDEEIRGDLNTRASYLRKQIQSRREGDKVALTVQRDGKEVVVEVTLGKILKRVLEQG